MPLQPLLLLTLLGPGSSFQLWKAQEDGAKETPGLLLARSWRQVDGHFYSDMEEDYVSEVTDPTEIFQNSPGSVTLSHRLLAVLGTLEQRGSAGPGTPELTTLATGNSTGIDAGGTATGNLSTQLATQGIPSSLGPVSKEQVIVVSPMMDTPSTDRAPSTELATMEAPSVGPAATEVTTQPTASEARPMESTVVGALSVGPAATEALTTESTASEARPMESTVVGALSVGPAATEALTTESTASEARPMESTVVGDLSMGPAATEALTTESTASEAWPMESTVVGALSVGPAATEALTTESTATEALSKEPVATTAPSMEHTATEALSTGPPTTRGPTTLLVPSDPHYTTTVRARSSSNGFIDQRKNHQDLFPGSSVAPSPTEDLDRIPVRQCLLAILILALVATIFFVCTVVLAVRLSRKNHTYPVRNYSPTEMVCISSLLPEGGEGPAPMANGDLPKARGQGLKAGPREGPEGDDLTLQSFLP